MNVGHDIKKALAHAQWLARENATLYRVFHCYMPSVYSVARSPLFVESIPHWHQGREEAWTKEMRDLNCYVVKPDGTILEPTMPHMADKPKKKKRR